MFQLILCLVTVVAVGLSACVSGSGRSRKTVNLLLTVIAGAGVSSWWLSSRDPSRLHTWDLYHYYVGTKYFTELGYDGIYECSLAALAERDPVALPTIEKIRDLRTNTFVSLTEALSSGRGCNARFTGNKWESFSSDVAWFKSTLGDKWAGLFMDHGFNPSPLWIAVARRVLPSGAVSNDALERVASIDLIILALMWGVVFLIYPNQQLAIAAVFWGTNGLGTFDWTGGAFLRHDWLFATVAAVAALRAGKIGTAGVLVAYAACVRVFPLLLAVGVLIAALGRNQRKSDARRFLVSLTAAGCVFVSVSLALFGSRAWFEFGVNLRKHVETRAGNLVGLPHVVDNVVQCRLGGYGGTDGLCAPPERTGDAPFSAAKGGTALVAGGLFCLWLRRASRRLSIDESAAVSIALLPLCTSAACYYYEAFLLFGLLPRHRWAGAGLVVLGALLYVMALSVTPPNKIYLVSSILVVQFVALLPVLLAREDTASKEG